VVLHRLVRGRLVRDQSGEGGYHLHEGADATGSGGALDHRGTHVESEQRHDNQRHDGRGLSKEIEQTIEGRRLRYRQQSISGRISGSSPRL